MAHSAIGQPSRAAARLKALGCGRIVISSRGKWRTSRVPTPYHKGSPLASTVTRLPRRAATAASVSVSGRCQSSRSAFPGATIARWRAPPTSVSAVSTSVRGAALNPGSPSSPMPMTDSHGFMTGAPVRAR